MRAPFEPFSQPDALQLIRKLQLADPETSADIDFVTKKLVPPGSTEELMSRRTDNLFVHPEQKLLMRIDCFGAADGWRTQVVIPEHPRVLWLAIIGSTHEECGHGSTRNTLHHVKNSFYWHGIRRDVKAVCDSCDKCQKVKAVRKNQAKLQPIKQYGVFGCVGVDLVAPLPESHGFTWNIQKGAPH